jgi:hypothetical protein
MKGRLEIVLTIWTALLLLAEASQVDVETDPV